MARSTPGHSPLRYSARLRLYRLFSALALAGYAPFAAVRSLSGRRKIGDLAGRLGRTSYPDLAGGIWVHAVSVGEVGVARNLLAELSRRAPGKKLALSASTAAGLDLAHRTAGDVAVFPFPLDLQGPVSRALSQVRPGLVLLTETEIWPLFLDRAQGLGIPVALVNGRLSARSHRGYRRLGRWFAGVLSQISIFAMQTSEDAERIASLGADPARIRVTGNVKYDQPAASPFGDAERLRTLAEGRAVLAAGSTAEGEEEIVLSAWEAIPESSRPLLAIAPRRPERFGAVAQLAERRGHRVVRRSAPAPAGAERARSGSRAVYLLDSIGELASLYGEAKLAFIGGSLFAGGGGHNPIEAWSAGVPVVTGPHTDAFREVTSDGERLGILERAGAGSLGAALARTFADPAALAERGERARAAVEESRGAAARTVEFVLPLLSRDDLTRSHAR
jgi:3-deoxy-D-manno-octulosonic-acid transferase